ncbi:mannan endo-1,4-beta-mannosidase 7-like [Silene latifolia]|uniref:mannan endo-1,4-beta-mannosidase 7-like n=1 Tax=Silene latifolia TaxID=37657 RepID=UPI003D76C509
MKNRVFILILFLLTFLGEFVKGENGLFVRREGVQFKLNGKEFYRNGFNAYWLMYEASFPSERQKVTNVFQEAASYSLTIARTWAFSDGGSRPLQSSPGVYNEQMFQGLDFVISEAKKHGIKLILSLVNNYNDYGGRQQYIKWANLSKEDDFYTNPIVKGFYKNHIKNVLTRVNTITKVAYKDEPTIMAWELINEPRCSSDLSGRTFQGWVNEMASYLKSIDGNHLLEIGLEGFYGSSTPDKIKINPNSYQFGTDFIANNQIPAIDFVTVHSYPDQWLKNAPGSAQLAFLKQWVDQHIADSQNILRKPVIFAEFGKSYKVAGYTQADRDRFYRLIYDDIYSSASKGGAGSGGLFWQLLSEGMDNYRDGYEIVLKQSGFLGKLIYAESRKLSILGR